MSTDQLFGVRVLEVDPAQLRARFRVFFIGENALDPGDSVLPDDPGFLLRVLWESAHGVNGLHGPLADLVGAAMVRDDAWIAAHTPAFVAEYARVATHRHPLDEDSFFDAATPIPGRDCWLDEDELARGDYEIRVTDARWLVSLRRGQNWGTTMEPPAPTVPVTAVEASVEEAEARHARRAEGTGQGAYAAALLLGCLRERRGATDLAAEAYQRAVAVARDPERESRALLFLGELFAARGDSTDAVSAYRDALESAAERLQHRDRPGIADLVRDMGRPDVADGPHEAAELLHARAGLRIGPLLAELGSEDEARKAYGFAETHGDPGMVQEARRLAGTETPGERGYRLHGVGTEEQARRALLDAYGSAAVADFGLALYDREFARTEGLYGPRFARAEALHAALTEPAERAAAARIACDLACVHVRESEKERAAEVLAVASGEELVQAFCTSWGERGPAADDAGSAVLRLLVHRLREHDDAPALTRLLAEALEARGPALPVGVFHQFAEAAMEGDDFAEAADWYGRAAELGNPRAAHNLGAVRLRQGELAAAQDAFAWAEKLYDDEGEDEKRFDAASATAKVAHSRGDWAVCAAALARAAYHKALMKGQDSETALWSLVRLGGSLADFGDQVAARAAYGVVSASGVRVPSAVADVRAYRLLAAQGAPAAEESLRAMADAPGHPYAEQAAALLGGAPADEGIEPHAEEAARATAQEETGYVALVYAHWIASQQRDGRRRALGEWLLRDLAGGTGECAARAAVTLGADAHRAEDDESARGWFLRAMEHDHPEMNATAGNNLGLIAKKVHDLPEALRWFGPAARSDDDGAALAAAHLGELCYWLGEFEQALFWYRRTLDSDTEDPELVGEAAYRSGEILHRRGEEVAARHMLRRAVDSDFEEFAARARELMATL
jgi:tetratricopeptide (TPR) repeat protein